MAVRVPVNPELLSWAADRAGLEDVERRFPKFAEWMSGELSPTFKQLEEFAKVAHAPLGYLFLEKPPQEEVPIPDFRTIRNAKMRQPSADLLDTIYESQMRQSWYRDYVIAEGHDRIAFVGSVRPSTPINMVADEMRRRIGFDLTERARYQNWEDARRQLIDAIEGLGVLVMVSGIVRGNTHRRLDPEEFRGFALADEMAPLIFVNGADTKAAQIFTLVHELAHIWAGDTALSDARMNTDDGVERGLWANRVAAEVLVPVSALRAAYRGEPDVDELERTSRRFARAVIVDALEGRTLYRDAYALLGTAKHETFQRMAGELGVATRRPGGNIGAA